MNLDSLPSLIENGIEDAQATRRALLISLLTRQRTVERVQRCSQAPSRDLDSVLIDLICLSMTEQPSLYEPAPRRARLTELIVRPAWLITVEQGVHQVQAGVPAHKVEGLHHLLESTL